MKLKIGDIFDFIKNRLLHKCCVVNIFEDDGRSYIVYKYFGIHRRWWHYEVKSRSMLEEMLKYRKIEKEEVNSDTN